MTEHEPSPSATRAGGSDVLGSVPGVGAPFDDAALGVGALFDDDALFGDAALGVGAPLDEAALGRDVLLDDRAGLAVGVRFDSAAARVGFAAEAAFALRGSRVIALRT